jgi:phenylpropionate dioxygenase-like ring-hydroxylating dioxygenase large terminal subunit
MTISEDNEVLTRVGPGTPMGQLMREYWLPAAKSTELKADAPPTRMMLLGEKLIAFRDSVGRVGIMDHRCPHRCASLFYGRNEENGLRCIYHGWKYDVEGNCLDQPNLPPHQDSRAKIKAKAYKVEERNGLIWVYMGARVPAPPLPALEATLLPETDQNVDFVQRECSWLQGVEGELDTSHIGFLHFGTVKHEDLSDANTQRFALINRSPEYIAQETEYGAVYAAHRPADERNTYWRFGQFAFPFWTMPPINPFDDNILNRAYIPMDDEHTMIVDVVWKHSYRQLLASTQLPGATTRIYNYRPNSTDWLGRYRLAGNNSNDHLVDREKQRTESFSGIEGVQPQDQAVQESMGTIVDRSWEHLAPSDMMIARVRRLLLRAARGLAADGTVPPGALNPLSLDGVRGGHFVASKEVEWLKAYADRRAATPAQVVATQAAE